MAVGFSSVAFSVLATDGTLPAPAMDERGWLTYSATLYLASAANVDALAALASTVTIKPAIGLRNTGTVVVEAGDGVRTLTFPTPESGERVFSAILTDLQPTGNLVNDAAWQCEASFLLIAETP